MTNQYVTCHDQCQMSMFGRAERAWAEGRRAEGSVLEKLEKCVHTAQEKCFEIRNIKKCDNNEKQPSILNCKYNLAKSVLIQMLSNKNKFQIR